MDASIEPKFEPNQTISGPTTLYGHLERIGGTVPKAAIRLLSGSQFSNCSLSKELARRLAPRLYAEIGLIGNAVWNANTYDLISFEALDISPYTGTSVKKAIENLSALIGKSLVEANIEEKIEDFRGE
jgi:hypothetical protein